jgi:hypothetical protein
MESAFVSGQRCMSGPGQSLSHLLSRSAQCGVNACLDDIEGRDALRVELEPGRRGGTLGLDFGDEPTFLLTPETLTHGLIQVSLRARLLPDAPEYARGFIGLAYRVQGADSSFEGVYLRPANGRPHAPPPPRDQRAVQHFAYPDWKFDRLREELPAQHEAGADIALDRWHRLEVALSAATTVARVDGVEVLRVAPLVAVRPGQVGLWVDIGTEGWFADLQVTPA